VFELNEVEDGRLENVDYFGVNGNHVKIPGSEEVIVCGMMGSVNAINL
jgi:hypothetical protein